MTISKWLPSCLMLALLFTGAYPASASTNLSGTYFATTQDIYRGAGTRIYSTATGSGYPVLASSWPELVGGDGYMYDYSSLHLPLNRFRYFFYHVNETGLPKYMGFAIRNLGANSVNLWVNRRGTIQGDTSAPARIGRDSQYDWFSSSTSDYYVATVPPGAWWFSTSSAYFHTSPVPDQGLLQGIYDMAVTDNVTGGPTTIRAVSFTATSIAGMTSPPAFETPYGSSPTGFNLKCDFSKLTFDISINLNSGNFKYFDIHTNGDLNPGERICNGYRSSPGVDGNYGIEYVINASVANSSNTKVHWTAVVANGNCGGSENHFAGRITSPGAVDVLGRTSNWFDVPVGAGGPMIPEIEGTFYDRGLELAYAYGNHSGRVWTQLPGGDCSPLRIYFYRD